ncbi:MAG: 3-phosphoshikimate 1-carboxyvinyltransferase [Actinomycetota bacterium]|nr:3-phosphoshikimate 1-carboxyvinyltransferase [Actinomycetota bacterium]
MATRRTARARPLTGAVQVPGDKSISHRALIVASLAPGRSIVSHANTGADVRATATALTQLGAGVSFGEGESQVLIEGCGYERLHEPEAVIDAGNSGTTLRMLLGVCAALPALSVLTGDESLRRRPMLRLVVPLRQMGATIDGRAHADRAPMVVRGGGLRGVDHELSIASAQVKSALLLAGLRADGMTSVREPRASRDHTERMLAAAGVGVERDDLRVAVRGGEVPAAGQWRVPGDLSSALFLVVAALLIPGSDLTVTGVGLNPTRTAALDALRSMGASLEVEEEGDVCGEPVGSIRARHSELRGTTIGPEAVPRLIDEIPALVVAATQADGTTEIRGAGELRVKESDRIATMAEGLSAIGGRVETLPDGLVVTGPSVLRGGEVDSRADHRVAMALAVAGLIATDRVRVAGWSSVETSFPEFLDVLGEAQRK